MYSWTTGWQRLPNTTPKRFIPKRWHSANTFWEINSLRKGNEACLSPTPQWGELSLLFIIYVCLTSGTLRPGLHRCPSLQTLSSWGVSMVCPELILLDAFLLLMMEQQENTQAGHLWYGLVYCNQSISCHPTLGGRILKDRFSSTEQRRQAAPRSSYSGASL